jgi:serine/threonine-protein kinase
VARHLAGRSSHNENRYVTEPTPRHRIFFAELKRRGIFKMAAVYGAVAFAVLQGADIILPSLGLPERTLTVVVVIALLGFPVAIAFAWAYELTGRGVKPEVPLSTDQLEEIAAQPRTTRWVAGVVALAFVVLMVGSGWLILARGPGDAPGADAAATSSAARIIVLPFTVRGSGEHDYLGEGMVDVLSRKLDVAGELRGVDPRAVLALVGREGGDEPGPERGRAIARRLEADYFVLGSVVEVGGQLQLDASLYDTEGGVEVIEATAVGGAEDVFGLVDEVASQLLLRAGAGSGSPVARIAAVTTDSLSALKDYLQGERALRGGQYLEAAEAFQRAVAVDSSFALAWYRLSVAYEWLTRDNLVAQSAEQAFAHSARLAERDRRLFEATVSARVGDHVQAAQQYRAIVGSYPDDVEAWFQLGEVLFHYGPTEGRSIAQSREAFERVLSYEPGHVNSIIHLGRVAAVEGDFQELDSLVDRFLAVSPDADRAVELRALRAIVTGDSIEWERTVPDLERVSDPVLLVTVAYVPVIALDLEAGRTLTGFLMTENRAPGMRALGHTYRGYLYAAQGRLTDAAAQVEAAAQFDTYRAAEFGAFFSLLPFVPATEDELLSMRVRIEALDPYAAPLTTHPSGYIRAHDDVHPQVRAALLGLLSARLGDETTAERYADELQGMESPERSPSFAEDLAAGVRAYVAWSRGESAAGLALLEQAPVQSFYQNGFRSPLYSGSLQRFQRAAFLEQVGRLEEALRWYGSFEQISMYDFVFLAPSHLRRAEIYERLGDLDQARLHYARFIELWSDPDPELRPSVDRAQERLAVLSSDR